MAIATGNSIWAQMKLNLLHRMSLKLISLFPFSRDCHCIFLSPNIRKSLVKRIKQFRELDPLVTRTLILTATRI